MRRGTTTTWAAFLIIGIASMAGTTFAQRPGRPTGKPQSSLDEFTNRLTPEFRTELVIELLLEDRSGAVAAQQWGRIFQDLGEAVRIRSPLQSDQPEIREQKLGRLRRVFLVGVLDRSGNLVFPQHKFSRSDVKKLAEWIRELKTFGAQGNPEGKPAFGLNETEFTGVFTALSTIVDQDTQDVSLDVAIARLGLPGKYPVRMTSSAVDWIKQKHPDKKTSPNLQGISQGTAFAILLNGYGLGFRPLRTPQGSIELAVSPLTETTDRWQVGWSPEELDLKPPQVAPNLYKIVPVELEEVPLADVLRGIAVAAEIPVFVDEYALQTRQIDIDTLIVNYPRRKTMWSMLLRGITNPHFLARRVLVDENNRGFVWITTIQTKDLQSRRLKDRSADTKR